MSSRALETWAWVLIYGGALSAGLSLFATDAAWSAGLAVGGTVAIVAGVACIVWRSRRP